MHFGLNQLVSYSVGNPRSLHFGIRFVVVLLDTLNPIRFCGRKMDGNINGLHFASLFVSCTSTILIIVEDDATATFFVVSHRCVF